MQFGIIYKTNNAFIDEHDITIFCQYTVFFTEKNIQIIKLSNIFNTKNHQLIGK